MSAQMGVQWDLQLHMMAALKFWVLAMQENEDFASPKESDTAQNWIVGSFFNWFRRIMLLGKLNPLGPKPHKSVTSEHATTYLPFHK